VFNSRWLNLCLTLCNHSKLKPQCFPFLSTKSVNGTCHHFQVRGRQQHQLQPSYASMDGQFRVSHCGLFLRFGLFILKQNSLELNWNGLLFLHSMTFGGVIYFLQVCYKLSLNSFIQLRKGMKNLQRIFVWKQVETVWFYFKVLRADIEAVTKKETASSPDSSD
jgi:hypothetical protein